MPAKVASKKGEKKAAAPATKGRTAGASKAPVKKAAATAKTGGPSKETPAAAVVDVPSKPIQSEPYTVAVKSIKTELVEDVNNKLRGAGWPALVSDNEANLGARFLQYSGCVVLEAISLTTKYLIDAEDVKEQIRQAALNAVRQGKPLIIDLDASGIGLFDKLTEIFDAVEPGLMKQLTSRSIIDDKEERYKKIIRSTDGEGYQSHYFLPDNMEKFYVICLSKIQDHTKLKEEFSDKFFMVNIED